MSKIRKREKCTRIKKNGRRCKNYKMPDSDLCLSHGGGKVITSKKKRKQWKNTIRHGQSSTILKKYGIRVSRLIGEVRRNKDYLDIDENVAVMTAIMRKTVERAEREGGMDKVLDEAKPIFQMLEKINRAILTKARIEEGLKHKIDIETIDIAMKQMIGIVQKCVKDPIILRKIADGFDDIKVHDLPMKNHKPRDDHLRELEELNNDMRESAGDIAGIYKDSSDKDWEEEEPTIVFEMDD